MDGGLAWWRRGLMGALVVSGCYCAPDTPSHNAFASLFAQYQKRFVDAAGRVVDRHYADQRTTSEAQAYGLFFALVADDRPLFARTLAWTQLNLARGRLDRHLPAWLWGKNPKGRWGVLDANSAADADLWMAYTLMQAGRLWQRPKYAALGRRLAGLIARRETVVLPKFGTLLLPGRYGFGPSLQGCYVFNPSYLPLPLTTYLAHRLQGPWRALAQGAVRFLDAVSPRGFSANWVRWCPSGGLGWDPRKGANGSYGAIRTYLWAGMTDSTTPGARGLLRSLRGMGRYLRHHVRPPRVVNAQTGATQGRGPVGFSAALLPYLAALHDHGREAKELRRVRRQREVDGLYGRFGRYYDQNLTLFALGFIDHAFRFHKNGSLEVHWQ